MEKKKHFSTSVGAGGNQWGQDTENILFAKSVSCYCQQF